MIVTKTPLRISFFGGGSDIPAYYNKHDGMVISTSIDKHIYIALQKCVAKHFKIIYSELELATNRGEIKHDRVREIMNYFNINGNIELASFSDINTKGTGLGSSSTFTVGVLNALMTQLNTPFNKRDLAELACHIEIGKCLEPIGKQDQYAATYGGFNVIRFNSGGVEVTPINVDHSVLQELNDSLMIYNTGISRQASTIMTEQVNNLRDDKDNIGYTNSIVDMAEVALKYLKQGYLDDFGALLDTSWRIKKKLSSNMSNDTVDELYEIGMKNGALGGKLLGAGGGGYVMFFVPQAKQGYVADALWRYDRLKVKFTDEGSKLELNI
jgi:D-glycero-alpha-D-manno-heptose-7-phosphate kinase